jgi:hypothetical protein
MKRTPNRLSQRSVGSRAPVSVDARCERQHGSNTVPQTRRRSTEGRAGQWGSTSDATDGPTVRDVTVPSL